MDRCPLFKIIVGSERERDTHLQLTNLKPTPRYYADSQIADTVVIVCENNAGVS